MPALTIGVSFTDKDINRFQRYYIFIYNYDNPIPATIETPWEMHTRMEVDSYEELSDRLNSELLSAAFDDLRTGMEL